MNDLLDKLEEIYKRWLQIGEDVAQPDVMSDMKRYIKLNKDYKDLQPVVEAYKKYKNIIGNIANAKDVLANEKDDEFRAMAKEELDQLSDEKEKLEDEIRVLLLPKDPQDDKNAQVEIRAGTGGDEASIFAGDLFRMYQHFCDKKGWKIDVVSMTEGTVGGYKEIVFTIVGEGAYGIMKYESGVHRVQRVPQTESQGRVHTSAASMARWNSIRKERQSPSPPSTWMVSAVLAEATSSAVSRLIANWLSCSAISSRKASKTYQQ